MIAAAIMKFLLNENYPWVFIAVYLLHFLGLIAHPAVTLLWAVEQVTIHGLGSSPRASDSRIVLSFVLNAGFVAICFYTQEILGAKGICALLAYASSHNLLGSIGTYKPMQVN
jgi:predicted membrane protein